MEILVSQAKEHLGDDFYLVTDKYNNEGYRNAMKQRESKLYRDIFFSEKDYLSYNPFYIEKKDKLPLFYCDPPYEGTKPYGYSFETSFNYKQYWDWVRELSKGAYVVCSEQNFPDDFIVIWEKETATQS